MPYILPRRKYNNLRPLEEREVNFMLQPAANKVQGHLSEHDFTSGAVQAATVSAGAYYRHHLNGAVVDPDFLDTLVTGSYCPHVGGNGPAATFVVVNDKQWHSVTDTTLSVSAEGGLIWVAAFLQYTYQAWTKSNIYEASVQFAIRIDGEVQEYSITGKWDETRKDWSPLVPVSPKSDTSLIGARRISFDTSHSLGAQHRPVRLGCIAVLSPGTHTVEVVARRVATPFRVAYMTTDDYIEVFTRRIYGMELSADAQGSSSTPAAVGATWMPDGTAFSKAAYETSRLDPIIGAYNAIKQGNCRRGTFNHAHLPSALHYANEEHLDGTLTTCSNEYPGFNIATIGDPGWSQVTDGTDVLETSASMQFLTYGDCWAVVMADIEIVRVRHNTDSQVNNFGMLTLMAHYAGAWHTIDSGAPECHFNAHYVWLGQPEEDLNLHVSLLYVAHIAVPTVNWTKVGLFASTWDGDGGHNSVTMSWRYASIKALVLRK